jgi:hypothetical protein
MKTRHMRVTGFFLPGAVLRGTVHKALGIALNLCVGCLDAAQLTFPIRPSHHP